MGTLQLINPHGLASHKVLSYNFSISAGIGKVTKPPKCLSFSRRRIRAAGTIHQDGESETAVEPEEPPAVNFAFVHSVLLPDGTPDVHFRTACGGQKLRDIMLDGNMELYGPYSKPLSNCSGVGLCGTCMVEVVQGNELLTPRNEKEKEKLKRKPKNWRLACQTTVGKPDSRGLVVIQQLPEWKRKFKWEYNKKPPSDLEP